jgi:hypothetical protein
MVYFKNNYYQLGHKLILSIIESISKLVYHGTWVLVENVFYKPIGLDYLS